MNIKKIATAAAKTKKPRATSFAKLKLGNEPKAIAPDKLELIAMLNWYNRTETTPEDRRDWVIEFMQEQKYSKDQISAFKAKHKKLLPTYGYIARIISNGATIDTSHLVNLKREIAKIINASSAGEDELDDDGNLIVASVAKKVVSTKLVDKSKFVAAEFIEFIDDEMDKVLAGTRVGSLYLQFNNRSLTTPIARLLLDFYTPQAEEFAELQKGKDAQLDEGYSHLNKKTRKNINDWMAQLITDLGTVISNKKVARVARKPKPKKAEQVVKHVKFQKEDVANKLVSVNPVSIIGAKSLWVFNTKTRQLGCYVAADSNGLSVKGTTIINGSGEMKKIRKPVEFLESFTGTAKTLSTKYGAIRSATVAMNGRLNQYTILLRTQG